MNDKKTLSNVHIFYHKATFDFDEVYAEGMTGEELKNSTTAFLKTLPWKA